MSLSKKTNIMFGLLAHTKYWPSTPLFKYKHFYDILWTLVKQMWENIHGILLSYIIWIKTVDMEILGQWYEFHHSPNKSPLVVLPIIYYNKTVITSDYIL